ncbi:MAG: hypothetical protein F6K58_32635, partial [Symploca sp. SIO2E9]|nr:hypothetical protein [Symploca sp. SIO2E9]
RGGYTERGGWGEGETRRGGDGEMNILTPDSLPSPKFYISFSLAIS